MQWTWPRSFNPVETTPSSCVDFFPIPRSSAASLLRCLLRCHVLVTTGGLRDKAIQHVPHGPAPPGGSAHQSTQQTYQFHGYRVSNHPQYIHNTRFIWGFNMLKPQLWSIMSLHVASSSNVFCMNRVHVHEYIYIYIWLFIFEKLICIYRTKCEWVSDIYLSYTRRNQYDAIVRVEVAPNNLIPRQVLERKSWYSISHSSAQQTL